MVKKKKSMTKKQRRLLQIIRRIKLAAILCVVLGVVLYLLSAFVFFKISSIEVVGLPDENGNALSASSFYTDEQIVSASGVNIGDSLVNISKSNIAASIEKILPYIGKVTVKREYPSTLALTVEDSGAYFAVESGAYILLSKNYKVLDAVPEMPNNCAKIVGMPLLKATPGEAAVFIDDTIKDRIDTLISACDDAGLDNVTKLDLSNIASVQIVFNNRITVTLGTITKLDEKLETAKKTINTELENNPKARILIDVADSSRAYVRDDKTPYEEESDEWTTVAADSNMNADVADAPDNSGYDPDGVG